MTDGAGNNRRLVRARIKIAARSSYCAQRDNSITFTIEVTVLWEGGFAVRTVLPIEDG